MKTLVSRKLKDGSQQQLSIKQVDWKVDSSSRKIAPPPAVDPETLLPLAYIGHMLPSQLSSVTRRRYTQIPQSHFPPPTAAPGV